MGLNPGQRGINVWPQNYSVVFAILQEQLSSFNLYDPVE